MALVYDNVAWAVDYMGYTLIPFDLCVTSLQIPNEAAVEDKREHNRCTSTPCGLGDMLPMRS
jgi:hypothetical protein